MADPTYTREEIEGALLSPDVSAAVSNALRDPLNKSKPGFALATTVIEIAIETGFGPK